VKKENQNTSSYILTRETFGMTLILFSALVLVTLCTHSAVFAGIGSAICTFMYGTFGYGSYLVVALFAYLGFWLVFEKSIKISFKTALILSLTVFVLFLLLHAITTNGYSLSTFGEYLTACYNNAELGFSGYTAGGVVSAIFVYPIAKATTFIGSYIILSILLVLCSYLSYLLIRNALIEAGNLKINESKIKEEVLEEDLASEMAQQTAEEQNYYPDQTEADNDFGYQSAQSKVFGNQPQYEEEALTQEQYKFTNLGKKILFENDEFAAESYRRNMIFNENSYFNNPIHNDGDYLLSFSDGKKKPTPSQNPVPSQNQTYSSSYQSEVDSEPTPAAPSSYFYGDSPVDDLDESADKISAESYKTEEDFTNGFDAQEEEDDYISFAEEESDSDQPYYQLDEEDEIEEEPFDEPTQFTEEPNQPTVQPTVEQRATQSEDSVADIDFTRLTRNAPIPEEPKEEPKSTLRGLFSADNSSLGENTIQPDASRLTSRGDRSNANLFDNDSLGEDNLSANFNLPSSSGGVDGLNLGTGRLQPTKPTEEENSDLNGRGISRPSLNMPERGTTRLPSAREGVNAQPAQPPQPPVEEKKEPEKPKHVWKKYVRPPIELLRDYKENTNINTAEIEESKEIIVNTLLRFKIESEIGDVVIGPAITRYDVIVKDSANSRNALKYKEAIAMELKKENLHAYLNYAKGAVSFEVPNKEQATVGLKTMLISKQFMLAKPNGLTFALGKNYDGEAVCPDITKMPHLLVAGTSGSGKSICISSLLVSLLCKYGPEELRFILVDPKQSEFIMFDNIPHLMINEIISDVDKAIKALNWAIAEMENRYKLFKEMTESGLATKDLNEYNSHKTDPADKLPKIVIILDEFGDLMLQAKKDIETRIVRLVQKARACGIHVILATQRPSVDCITGLIKSNLATRIGFKVGSVADSMTIFDVGGAEKLIGKGDMYFRSSQNPNLTRIQGCFIDTPEVQAVTDFVKQHNETYFDQTVSDFINKVEEAPIEDTGDVSMLDDSTKIDDVYVKALWFCVNANQASVSMLQRRFPIGYVKACKIIDWMTNMNYITQPEGSKPRKVILSRDEFISTYGEIED